MSQICPKVVSIRWHFRSRMGSICIAILIPYLSDRFFRDLWDGWMKNLMQNPGIRLPHFVIVKSSGLLPMLYKIQELSQELKIPDRTLRDWISKGAPHLRDERGHLWVNGQDFAHWISSQRKSKLKNRLAATQARCFHCAQIVEIADPTITKIKGQLVHIRGRCPNCGGQVYRGGRLKDTTIRSTAYELAFPESEA